MPILTIDDKPVEVTEGTNVLEAARSIGIVIPHFCWHPALGRAGACRACAVRLIDGPVKGIQMSCMLPAQDGMVVSTADPEAVALRRAVIEWLMINHPHDCPVCDEGGECQLQDFTIAGGHGIRRYAGHKRTHVNQYLGGQISHEMNRCIQCYRCVRFYQEYAGGTDFGVTGRSASVYFGRHADGQLQSPFSGNLVDICPTGVFTDKTARFRARYWDYDMAPSLCPGCSLGCNTVPMARYRELLKITARQNEAVNGWFICDRGRFSAATTAVNAPERPRQALVDQRPVALREAVRELAERIRCLMSQDGRRKLAVIGSGRMTYEAATAAAHLRDACGDAYLSYFADAAAQGFAMQAIELAARYSPASQEDVRRASLVVVIGGDLLSDAPMMALAVRQAWRSGAEIFGIDTAVSDLYPVTAVADLASVPLAAAVRPVVLVVAATQHVEIPSEQLPPATRLTCILPDPDSYGAASLAHAKKGVPLTTVLADAELAGIIAFEADVAILSPATRVLAAADWLPTALLERAEIVLPVTAWVEMTGSYVNNEGRRQYFEQVMHPGSPLRGLTVEQHPPRTHSLCAPGSDILPTATIIHELLAHLETDMSAMCTS